MPVSYPRLSKQAHHPRSRRLKVLRPDDTFPPVRGEVSRADASVQTLTPVLRRPWRRAIETPMNTPYPTDPHSVPEALAPLAAAGLVHAFHGPEGETRWRLTCAGQDGCVAQRAWKALTAEITPSDAGRSGSLPIVSGLVEACGVAAAHPLAEHRFWLMNALLGALAVDESAVAIETLHDAAREGLPPAAERMFIRSDAGAVVAINYQVAYEDEPFVQLSAALALHPDTGMRLAILQTAALLVLQDPEDDLKALLEQAA